ncbi:hypothetical protein GOP47_0002727 [Adiantum capillus-veneris]|uniref:Transferase n=1 Tax=Adiantum capillus-veneris TaxID=13818 RepID=A0A9D4VBF4_ADICA|nr:hypothetical protein GOP47_0002727 [Adiantum capillus-veneris]
MDCSVRAKVESSDDLHLQITKTSVVKPLRPTHRFNFYLSPSDTFFLNFNYVRSVLFYPALRLANADYLQEEGRSCCDIQTLKDGLAKVLVDFYPVAGRFRHENDGSGDKCSNIVIDCNDAGVEFREAFADYDFFELQEEKFPIHDLYSGLTAPTPFNPFEEAFLSIQVTTFRDGCGIAIGATASHAVFDGSSYSYFLRSWGQCCRGLGVSLPPFHVRTVLDPKCWLDTSKLGQDLAPRPRAAMEIPNVKRPSTKGHCRVLHFDSAVVQQLKRKAIQESGNPSISSYQAVLASIWKRLVEAYEMPPEQMVCLYLKADLRQRLRPALTPAYFGNALDVVNVQATVSNLREESVGVVAARIRKAIDVLNDEEYIRGRLAKPGLKFMEFMQLLGELMSGRIYMFFINHGPKSALFEVDLGFGRPLAVRPSTLHNDRAIDVYPGQEMGSMDVCMRFTSTKALQAFLSIPSPSIVI